MSTDMSIMRNKEDCDNKSMRNRQNFVVKTPEALEVPLSVLQGDSSPRSSTVTVSDSESLRDSLSFVGSTKDNASDRGHYSSDDSIDSSLEPQERLRLKLFKDRKNALDELLNTEKSYILDLEQIVLGYMELIKQEDIPKPQTLVGKELMVFGNLPQIYEWHKNTFQPEMEKYIDSPQKLGAIFSRFEKRFYMYVKYCENKPKSEDKTYENLDYFEQLREILDHKLQLADMLIKPVQRIMKYELLLKAIMKYTEKAGEDIKNLQRAIEVMCIIPGAANDMMSVGRLQGFDGKVTAQGRLLLQDTMEVCEQTSKNTLERINFKERKAFLFEQIIIFGKTVDSRKNKTGTGLHYLFSGSIRVNKMILTEMPNNPLSFRLVDKSPGAATQYLCQCKSESIKKNWTTQIKILLNNQTDFLKALQSPISYQREINRIDSGDASASTFDGGSSDPTSKKPPKSSKKSKNTRSFRNLFIKQIHLDNANPKPADCSPTTNSRKFSLPFFEAFSAHKTPEVESKSKRSLLAALTRRKNSTATSPLYNEGANLMVTSDDHLKHLSVSNENICDGKSTDGDSTDEEVKLKIPPKTAGSVFMRNAMLFMDTPKKAKVEKPQSKQEEEMRFVKELENTTTTEGSTVLLSCQLSNSSASISWVGPDGELLSEGQNVMMEDCNGVFTLKLLQVHMNQSGTYQCKASSNKNNNIIISTCQLKILPEILPKPKRKTTLNNSDLQPDDHQTNSIGLLMWSDGFEKKYELKKVTENGKFSVVFQECLERTSKTKYLAKCYLKTLKSKNSVAREANFSYIFSHPSIFQAQKLFETSQSYIILFPFITYRSRLFEYIIHLYSFDDSEAINFTHQLFSALNYLHERNILHLGIKPENLNVDQTLSTNPILQLADFSEARTFDPNEPYIHPFDGDSEFTPPEVLHGAPLTLNSDVWNGAILLYAMLSGTTPFYNEDDDILRKRIVSISYEFPKSLFTEVNPSVTSFISSLLVMPPSQRPNSQSCTEKCNHLKIASKREPINKSKFVEFITRRQKLQTSTLNRQP